MYLYMI